MSDDTIPTYTTLSTIAVQHINLIKQVLAGDYVPRNSAGVATTAAGSLGTSTYDWLAANIRLINFGLSADGVSLSVDGIGDIIIKRATVEVGKIDSGGFIGSGLKDDSVSNTKRIYGGTGVTASQDGYALGTSTGTFFTGATGFTDITSATCTITSAGRPIKVGLVADGSANAASIQNSGTTGQFQVKWIRDSTDVAIQEFDLENSGGRIPSSSLHHTDPVVAGTYVYKLQVLVSGSAVFNCLYSKLEAIEI